MKFAVIGNLDKPGLPDALRRLVGELNKSGAEFVIDRRIASQLDRDVARPLDNRLRDLDVLIAEADVLITLGGDGTILHAAGLVGAKGTPILGVNLGKLGFLAEFSPEEVEHAVRDILGGKYVIEERMLLRATYPGGVLHAVNDVVIDKSRSSRIIDLETYIDGAFAVTYTGDGLVISTPTGSTAYALSSGGPIVIPTSRVIGITPIAPHTLNGRPLIVPDTSRIRVVVREGSEEVALSADGQGFGILKLPAEVTVEHAPYTIRLVKRTDRSYFDVLRAKLFWGQDARSLESRV